jgi:hypothetical protein
MPNFKHKQYPSYYQISLNPVPNAQVCIWPFWSNIDIRPPWGQACLSYTATHVQGGGYLFLPGFFFMYDAIYGWMAGWMDKSCDKKSFMKNNHDVFYYM